MPCGEDIEMTPEEQETWLQEKSAELEALMPLTDQEFLDEGSRLALQVGPPSFALCRQEAT
ncbi:unnamed protein product [Durusdinium trenchii]|uniref:Uncharacterized protein n=1 Tax=Durusdinium trenchii TaxID=1381693 RepID=A0ABP0LXG4_9DINO